MRGVLYVMDEMYSVDNNGYSYDMIDTTGDVHHSETFDIVGGVGVRDVDEYRIGAGRFA